MIAVAKTSAVAVLQQLDPVEDATAHIGRAFERVDAVAGNDDRLLITMVFIMLVALTMLIGMFKPFAKPRVACFSQKALTDAGNARERNVEIDERVLRISRRNDSSEVRRAHG